MSAAVPFRSGAESDNNLRLIQIIYGLVIAQSLVFYREIVLEPFKPDHLVAAMALLTVLVTTVFSWIDFHRTVFLFPYQIARGVEACRLGADLGLDLRLSAVLDSAFSGRRRGRYVGASTRLPPSVSLLLVVRAASGDGVRICGESPFADCERWPGLLPSALRLSECRIRSGHAYVELFREQADLGGCNGHHGGIPVPASVGQDGRTAPEGVWCEGGHRHQMACWPTRFRGCCRR